MIHFSSINACDVTTMHCGGRIERMFEPESREQLGELIAQFDEFVVLGGGSNIIFEDSLITKPVIRLGKGFDVISRSKDHIYAGAALSTRKMLSYCANNDLSGLEFMAGIPGTIGGALFMNAGTRDAGIMDAVYEVEFMDRTGLHFTGREKIAYGYRDGGFSTKVVILGARFSLKKAGPDEVRQTIAKYIQKKRGQPRGYSSGSVFKNPPESPAGLLIEQADMKGYSVGDALVSKVHANFIINKGNASTSDVKTLISMIKHRVREKSGIELIEEVRIIG